MAPRAPRRYTAPVLPPLFVTRRRALVTVIGYLAAHRSVMANASSRTYRIGAIGLAPADPSDLVMEEPWNAFRDELRRLGYTQGREVVIERRSIDREEQAPAVVAELLAMNVDLLVISSTPVALVARKATSTVPIVLVGPTDPERTGLVTNLARPGGNVTGVARVGVGSKRLEFIRQIGPRISKVAVVWAPNNAAARLSHDELPRYAKALGMTLISVPIRDASDVMPGLDRARRDGAQAIYLQDAVISHQAAILKFARSHRLVTAGSSPRWTLYGAVFAYGPNSAHVYGRAAVYVDKILKGARPGDLPVEQSLVYELVVNQQAARAIGLTVPKELLQRADRVIE